MENCVYLVFGVGGCRGRFLISQSFPGQLRKTGISMAREKIIKM